MCKTIFFILNFPNQLFLKHITKNIYIYLHLSMYSYTSYCSYYKFSIYVSFSPQTVVHWKYG